MSQTTPALATERAPLMLWCSSHSTLAAEEIPLLLQAGFRVIPLLTDFWTFEYKPEIDARICSDWKASVGLPEETVRRLQAIKFCANMGQDPFDQAEIDLLNEVVDVIYVTVLPNLAMRLAPLFKGTVIFRPFGHGHLNTYTNVAEYLKADLASLAGCPNFLWAPILSTLQEPEDPRLCRNANQLSAFVSPSRLGSERWSAATSQPYVVETIPRIAAQPYYLEIYKQYRQDHGQLPLKILGGNPVAGGELNDPSIVGFMDDEAYFRTAAQARVSIYHGRSRYHVHYHPIEFMALGTPVLFHEDSAFASEGERFGMTRADLQEAGMYASVEQANEMATAALAEPALADRWSHLQRVFLDEVFSRKKALDQARWIRRRVIQLRPWTEQAFQQRSLIPSTPAAVIVQPDVTAGAAAELVASSAKKPIPQRVYRELKRLVRQAKRPLKGSRAARRQEEQHQQQFNQLAQLSHQLQVIGQQTAGDNLVLQAVQAVHARVDSGDQHLQNMAVDVQVLAERYHQLSDSVNQLQELCRSALQPASTHLQPNRTHPQNLKFYGQFTPPVDRFLFERYFPDTNIRGTFIECGAFDGQLECSCKFFEETMGWTGYNLEPSPHIFANLQRNRPHSLNYQVALSNRIGTASFKLVSHPQLGLNYGNGSLSHTDQHTQLLIEGGCTFDEVEVPLLTYRAFIQRENIAQVDLFVLDVEGHELDVIAGMHGSSVLPDIICVEVGHTPLAQVRSALAALGYVYDISSHVNAFFIQQSKLSLFTLRQSQVAA